MPCVCVSCGLMLEKKKKTITLYYYCYYLIIFPPKPLNDVLVGFPAIKFLRPCSSGNPIASVVLPLAFFAYRRISVFDNLILKAQSKRASGARYLCGICNKKVKISEFVGHSFNK